LPSITGNIWQYFLCLLHLMYIFLFHTPVSNMQTRIGMILSLVWTTRLITMLFLLWKMLKLSMNWRIIWEVIINPTLQTIISCTCSIIYWAHFILFSGCNADIHVIVKIESADSIPNLHSIITASDGVRNWS
jgi:hypothetical protein